jgi:hypothetical protein
VARRATFSNRRLLQPSCHIELTVAERFLTGDVLLRRGFMNDISEPPALRLAFDEGGANIHRVPILRPY